MHKCSLPPLIYPLPFIILTVALVQLVPHAPAQISALGGPFAPPTKHCQVQLLKHTFNHHPLFISLQKLRDSVPTDEVVPESGDGRPPRKPPRAQDGSTYLHVPEAPGPVDDEEFLHQVSVRGGEGAETALASRSRPQGTETVTGRTARPPGPTLPSERWSAAPAALGGRPTTRQRWPY